jgi:hypothetical protein
MKQKGTEEAESTKHHARMTAMKASFAMGDMGLFGAVDVGHNACWRDYGMLRLYSKNSLLLLDKDTAQSDLLSKLLGVTSHVTVDEASSTLYLSSPRQRFAILCACLALSFLTFTPSNAILPRGRVR